VVHARNQDEGQAARTPPAVARFSGRADVGQDGLIWVCRNVPTFPDKKSPSVEHRLVKINLLKLKCVRIRFKQPVWRDRPSLVSLGRVVHSDVASYLKINSTN
jgi:hypothetical protein